MVLLNDNADIGLTFFFACVYILAGRDSQSPQDRNHSLRSLGSCCPVRMNHIS